MYSNSQWTNQRTAISAGFRTVSYSVGCPELRGQTRGQLVRKSESTSVQQITRKSTREDVLAPSALLFCHLFPYFINDVIRTPAYLQTSSSLIPPHKHVFSYLFLRFRARRQYVPQNPLCHLPGKHPLTLNREGNSLPPRFARRQGRSCREHCLQVWLHPSV